MRPLHDQNTAGTVEWIKTSMKERYKNTDIWSSKSSIRTGLPLVEFSIPTSSSLIGIV